jgi:hemoglobin
MLTEQDLYAHLGEDGFTRLIAAFFRRVAEDDVLGPLYRAATAETGETLAEAEHPLRGVLVQRFGGPAAYSAERGHPRLRMRHMRFTVDVKGAQRWLDLMEQAMEEESIDPEARAFLRPYFRHTAALMVNTE